MALDKLRKLHIYYNNLGSGDCLTCLFSSVFGCFATLKKSIFRFLNTILYDENLVRIFTRTSFLIVCIKCYFIFALRYYILKVSQWMRERAGAPINVT